MNRSLLGRKLVYLAILVAMLVPLYLLGQPSSREGDPGGQLSAMRLQYDIAESNLGEISPSSETMKLASLGLRGVAATLLWSKANEYQIEHEWDRHRATVNNIALLQPHFSKVWEYQAHNLTYNVSKEFDDYRQRYEMVREGSEFLINGVRQNRKAPRLVWYTGWFYGSKIGMADEKRQFRRLFADDEIAHQRLSDEGIPVDSPEARGPSGKPDNWLVSRLWLNYGYDLVDSGVPIKRQTPLNFYETGPKGRLKHAEAIESEGVLDEGAVTAWQLALKDWVEFGNRSIPTTSLFTIKLDELDEMKRQRSAKVEEFRKLVGEPFDAIYDANVAALDERMTRLYNTDPSELPRTMRELRENMLIGLEPKMSDLVGAIPLESRLKGVKLIDEIRDFDARINKTRGYRDQINYGYWKKLAEAEQEERTVRARRLIYNAERAYEKADLDQAITLYEEAFEIWSQIYHDYPMLTTDDSAEDIYRSIRRYMVAIDSEDLKEDFPLITFAQMMSASDGNIPPGAYDDELLFLRMEEEKAAEESKSDQADAEDSKEDESPEDESPESESAESESDDAESDDSEAEMKASDDAAEDEPADTREDETPAEPSETDDAETESTETSESEGDSTAESEAEPEESAPEKDSEEADPAAESEAEPESAESESTEPEDGDAE